MYVIHELRFIQISCKIPLDTVNQDMFKMAGVNEVIVPPEEFHAFVVRAMGAVGITEGDACALADLLVSADYRGHYTHGLNRLGK